jgi:peptidoglycan hydrolase CwlO-like protein
MQKKLGYLVGIIFFLINFAFAEDIDCNTLNKYPCDKIGEVDFEKVSQKCNQSGITALSQRLDECKKTYLKEKETTQSQLENIQTEESKTKATLSRLDSALAEINFEIAELNLNIESLEKEIKKREKSISELEDKLKDYIHALEAILKAIYEYDQESSLEVLIFGNTLSQVFQKFEELEKMREALRDTILDIKEAKLKLEEEKNNLEEAKKTKLELKSLREIRRQSLMLSRQEQASILQKLAQAKTPLEREMARIEAELQELKIAMDKIRSYLLKWTLTGNVTWASIFKAVSSASSATGVREALLLGVLQAETRFGQNLGKAGKTKEYCIDRWGGSTREYDALVQICSRFGYDPNNVPMSRSCAIGPSQFLPSTWLSYEKLCPGIYNPWDLNHAVLATACYLKRNGATSGNERTALFVYNQSSSYVDAVLSYAEAWQEIINLCGGLNLDCPSLKERLEATGIPTA